MTDDLLEQLDQAEQQYQPKVSVTARQVHDGMVMADFLSSAAGKIFINKVYDRYAEYLADMLNPDHTPDQLYKMQCKIHALLDVMGDVGITVNAAELREVQRRLAKRHINDELTNSGRR